MSIKPPLLLLMAFVVINSRGIFLYKEETLDEGVSRSFVSINPTITSCSLLIKDFIASSLMELLIPLTFNHNIIIIIEITPMQGKEPGH